MSDARWCVVAVAAVVLAWVARWQSPFFAGIVVSLLFVVASGLVAQRLCGGTVAGKAASLVGVAILLGVSARLAVEIPALERARRSESYTGWVELRTDPTASSAIGMGPSAVVRASNGDYVRAMFPRDSAVAPRLLAGERVYVSGFIQPDPPQQRWRFAATHVVGRLDVTDVASVEPADGLWAIANRVRQPMLAAAQGWSPDARALYAGVVVGDDREQPAWQQSQFRRAGMSHLLAVSGQNVAFVLVVAQPLLRRLSLRPRTAVLLVVVLLFALVTRLEPSVLRATVMAAIVALSTASGQPVPGLRALALTTCAWLVIDPFLAYSLGFLLSLCASAGLLILVRPIAALLPARSRIVNGVIQVFAATVAAQIATAPIIIGLAGGVPTVSILANVLAVPLAGIIITYGMSVGLVAGVIGLHWLMWPMQIAIALLSWIGAACANIALPRLTTIACVVIVLSLVVLRFRPQQRSVARLALVATLVLGLAADRAPSTQPTSTASGATVYGSVGSLVVLQSPSSASRVLRDLESADLISIDTLIVVNNSVSSALVVAELTRAYRIGRVIVPWGRYLSDHEVVGEGQQRHAGPVNLVAERVDASRDRLVISGRSH